MLLDAKDRRVVKMQKRGRPSLHTPELLSKIQKSILFGKNVETIIEELGISTSTWYTWYYEDYKNFRSKVDSWRRDRKLYLASKNLEELLSMSTETTKFNKDGDPYIDVDAQLLRIKADMTRFTLEALDPNFNKKQQLELSTTEPITGFKYVTPIEAEVIENPNDANNPSDT